MGEPFNIAQQKRILHDCLKILEANNHPGIIVDSPYRWKINKFS